jgi:DNA polymerase-3 subunit gamma/tau
MENFIVSARKYRPATFDTVVGQKHITDTLKNAIKNNRLAQAFLLCGPRGVGKTTCARILAKTINCENRTADTEACGKCSSCVTFQNNASFNVYELDAASNNSVDDIRKLVEQVRFAPQQGKYKVYIIDEVHMLSNAAFNAFLKTLEEPPSYAIFILATTERHKIIPTILSRCQIFEFNRISVLDIAEHLQKIAHTEGIQAEADALHLIGQKADGCLRDALSLFDSVVNFVADKVITYEKVVENLHILDYDYYFKLTDLLLAENTEATILFFDEILRYGFDAQNFLGGLQDHFRNLMMCKYPNTVKLLEVPEGVQKKYLQQAQAVDASWLLSALNLTNHCDLNYKNSKQPRLLIELTLMKLCHLRAAIDITKLELSGGGEKKKSDVAEVSTVQESHVKYQIKERKGLGYIPRFTNGQAAYRKEEPKKTIPIPPAQPKQEVEDIPEKMVANTHSNQALPTSHSDSTYTPQPIVTQKETEQQQQKTVSRQEKAEQSQEKIQAMLAKKPELQLLLQRFDMSIAVG